MPASPITLTPELIARFESAVTTAVPGYADQLQPGLSEEELAAVTKDLPGELPGELKLWWSWRNGLPEYRVGERPIAVPEILGRIEYRLSSLQACVDHYLMIRSHASDYDGVEPDVFVPPALFPFEQYGWFSIELAAQCRQVSPVIYTGPDREFGAMIAPTFGTVISWWTEALENGWLRWGPEFELGWEVDEDLIQPELLRWYFT